VLATFCFAVFQQANAQLKDGELAPDFTAVDYNGVSHHLYEYLDQGYDVFIDVSATWCAPCWGFHESNTLKNLYTSHGPAGKPGVAGSTTNDVMVLFIEGEKATCTPQLTGGAVDCPWDQNDTINWYEVSRGNWILNTPFPIIDKYEIGDDYEVSTFPTLFRICPNRRVKLESVNKVVNNQLNFVTANDLYSLVGSCPEATTAVNPALLTWGGDKVICEPISPKVIMQNFGTQPLTSASIQAIVDGTVLGTFDWTGNLATNETAEIQVPNATISRTSTVLYRISSANDVTSDDSLIVEIQRAVAPTTEVRVEVTTDGYGAETRWFLVTEDLQQVLAAGGPFNNLPENGGPAFGTTVQPPVTFNLPAGQTCYYFALVDEFGDGMCCDFGLGSYKVFSDNTLFLDGPGVFDQELLKLFYADIRVGIDDNMQNASILVFPNPANDLTNIRINSPVAASVTVKIVNALGQQVSSQNFGKMAAGLQLLNISSSDFPGGLYFFNVQVGEHSTTHKITISH